MLWIFVLALIMPISLGNCDDTNLAHVTWAHAVNSEAELTAALDNDNIQMIEADVIFGEHEVPAAAPAAATPAPDPPAPAPQATENKPKVANDEAKKEEKPATDVQKPADQTPDAQAQAAPAQGTPAVTVVKIPVMGHPPAEKSNFSLAQFLDAVVKHNKYAQKPKGVKLDFKSIDALKQSEDTFKSKYLKGELWINADILVGPGKKAGGEVNATEFFDAIHANKDLVNKTLSIGWTTELNKDKKVSYEKDHIDAMTKAIEDSKISVDYPITFPVRAAIAAESKETLHNLYDAVSKDRKVTFTIWSGADDTDKVDVGKLQEFINSFGVDKVYVDVPEDLEKKINLTGGASATVKFGLFNLAAIVIAMFFRNGLH